MEGLRALDRRATGSGDRLPSSLQFSAALVDRIGLETELKGHYGCVNCLEFNGDGSVLASASDDLHVILWDPLRHRIRHRVATGHGGNIFSVKFVNPRTVATCAADYSVRVQSISEASMEHYTECTCHYGRVKRLATAPDCPDLIWSAGEDGLILQHDLRENHSCSTRSPAVVVNLINQVNRQAEAKCLAINPRRPEQLAVGANDFYVRIYDRRMIKLVKYDVSSPSRADGTRESFHFFRGAVPGDPENLLPRGCVQYFAPGHLSTQDEDSVLQKKATTYLTFSHDGNELLVNLGSEQVYMFDINGNRRATLLESFILKHNYSYEKTVANNHKSNVPNGEVKPEGGNGTIPNEPPLSKEYVLPLNVKMLKEKANHELNESNYVTAVHLYNQAISLCSDCALLYSSRAAALMRRNWTGDIYAAIRDCYTAIHYDPYHLKSHFRLAKALMELKKAKEAQECLIYFKDKFPKQANSHAVCLLQKDVNLALKKLEASTPTQETSEYDFEMMSQQEKQFRASSKDYSHRYLGHCNTTTDIKEANFLGQEGNFIAAGSDDGSFFIWSRKSGNIVRCLRGDDSIVNCIQVHPTMCLIATSGIENVVRLWSPLPEDGRVESRKILDIPTAASANQRRMQADPFEAMILNIAYHGGLGLRPPREARPGVRGFSPEQDATSACRAS